MAGPRNVDAAAAAAADGMLECTEANLEATPMPRRRSLCKTVCKRLNTVDREFLHLCLGDDSDSDEFLSLSDGSEGFRSLPSSPSSAEASSPTRRLFYAMHTESDDDDAPPDDAHSGLEAMFRFDSGLLSQALGDDSDEDGDDGEGLEALYCFDLEKVAEALRQGAGVDELTKVIEDSMGDVLQSRLETMGPAIHAESPASEQSDSEGSPDHCVARGRLVPPPCGASGRSTPSMASRLSGRMTPPPGEDPAAAEPPAAAAAPGRAPPGPEAIAAHVKEALGDGAARARLRSSSALQHVRIAEAVNEAAQQHRQSLARACIKKRRSRRMSNSAVRRLVANDCKRTRQCLIKAAEVLEVAGIGVEGDGEAKGQVQTSECEPDHHADPEISDKLRLVQDAVKGARRRHRHSIAHAVHEAAAAQGNRLPCQSLGDNRVQEIISKAYARYHQEVRDRPAAQSGTSSPEKGAGGMPRALMRTGSLVALMHARAGDAGMGRYTVHCGPAKETGRMNTSRVPGTIGRRG